MNQTSYYTPKWLMVYITNDYENIKFYNKNNHNLETIRVCFSQQFLLNVYFMCIFAFKHFFFYYFFVFLYLFRSPSGKVMHIYLVKLIKLKHSVTAWFDLLLLLFTIYFRIKIILDVCLTKLMILRSTFYSI